MTLNAIEALLRKELGLNPTLMGPRAIDRAVRKRMTVTGFPDVADYLRCLRSLPGEVQELIEEVVVSETWFFRDQEPFDFLSRYVFSDWLPVHPGESLRILSAPCSTGEEPYSIAITLLERGLPASRFHIDAVDVSHEAIAAARRGLFGRNSFRSRDLEFRGRHFRETENGFELNPEVRNTVRFQQGNLFDLSLLKQQGPYHFIFCRNLLIYLDDGYRGRLIDLLAELLIDDGLLFVASAEAGSQWHQRFAPFRSGRVIAYQKKRHPVSSDPSRPENEANGSPAALRAKPSPEKRSRTPRISVCAPPLRESAPQRPRPPRSAEVEAENPLERAVKLADRGQLEPAARICETVLQERPDTPQAYFLLGLIQQASGRAERAEESFSRALYLNPNDYDALIHLAALRERRGDGSGAEKLRQRARRLEGVAKVRLGPERAR